MKLARLTCVQIEWAGQAESLLEAPLAEDRLSGSDKRILVLWILAGIVGALFAHKHFFQAFPEASVDFKVSRAEAQKRAQNFIAALGENVNGYQSTIVFDVDENAKTYLERELGLQRANQLMSGELSIWYWDVRFFRPQQEEEFLVRVSPAGQVVGYDHKIQEARAAPSFGREEASAAAESFAQSKLGVDLNQWDFLQAEANSQSTAESRGLVVYLGTQRVQGEGSAVSLGSGTARRPHWRQSTVPASAGSVVPRLRAPTFHE